MEALTRQSVKVSVGTIWRHNCTALWCFAPGALHQHQAGLQTWCGFTVWYKSGWKVFWGGCQKRVDCSIRNTSTFLLADSPAAELALVNLRLRCQDIAFQINLTTLFKTFGSKTHDESLWYVVLAAQSCLSKYYRRASIPGEIWAAKDEGKERKPHCASASCLPEARTFPFRPRAAPKLYLSDPNSISQFFTSHTTLSIKLSVSHFFNCPQATKLNLCLSDKFCCLWSKV